MENLHVEARRPATGSAQKIDDGGKIGRTTGRARLTQPLGPVVRWTLAAWTASPKLADILRPDRNSFGVLRLMLALAVLVSHAVFLRSGSSDAEPLVALTGYSLGQYGVQGFFILSGILVTQSLASRMDLLDYARARMMRIFPALIVCVLATTMILGLTLTSLGAATYLTSAEVPAYILRTLSLSTGSAALPGLFQANPAPGVANQSLWTLKYEVACYAVLGLLATVVWIMPARRSAILTLAGIWAASMVFLQPNLLHNGDFVDTLAYFALFFGTGVTAWLLRERIRLTWLALPLLAAVFALSWGTGAAEIASAVFVGYGTIYAATFRFGILRAATNSNDYSYGTYIYGYPISQSLIHLIPSIDVVSLVALTAVFTLTLAAMSWRWIERPALALVARWRSTSPSAMALKGGRAAA